MLEKLQPLSQQMIIAALDAREFVHQVDADGDVFGNFQGSLIYFFRIGEELELLQVRVLTSRSFTTDDVPRLYRFCNAWNHDRLFPKAYVHVADDGAVRVIGEVIADWEKGVTPAQLDHLMICGIATGCQLAEAVNDL